MLCNVARLLAVGQILYVPLGQPAEAAVTEQSTFCNCVCFEGIYTLTIHYAVFVTLAQNINQ